MKNAENLDAKELLEVPLSTFIFLCFCLMLNAQKTGQIYYMQVVVEDAVQEKSCFLPLHSNHRGFLFLVPVAIQIKIV
jgi:hypothetical protein